ncbi:hypothetical protein AcW1_003794 [Taiwanofungus camphoratus]|nr:hypothetical protein AcW1_003794 [Antrodia cinnamomea]KAI0958174.1 hypothetical protein AcV7_004060 [Antrodia cinnamomea]
MGDLHIPYQNAVRTTEESASMSENGQTQFKLGSFAVDEHRPIKVVVIGAGFSGIIAGIRFPQKLQNLDLTIYEKNAGIGGTWYTNKYPGLACDIPSHCYQLTFEQKTDWSSCYAPAHEILSYMRSVVDKYKLMHYIKLQHELVHAQYDEPSGKWHLRIRRPAVRAGANGGPPELEEFEDTADILFTAAGGQSRWKWPDIEGLHDFKGTLFHSANFDVGERSWEDMVTEWADKRVGVIGMGSSAVQIVPALQPRVAKVVNYSRSKGWFCPPLSVSKLAELLKRDPATENYAFTDEDKRMFADPIRYKEFRHALEADMNSAHHLVLRESELQKAVRAACKGYMLQKLAKKPWIADHLIPDWSVCSRRLTPAPGYLDAVCEDNVEFILSEIKRVTATGIETADGKHESLDIIICATGYDTSFQYKFPVIGRSGVSIQEKWSPYPQTYLTVCTDGFPNWFMAYGPNAASGVGSLLPTFQRQVEYAVEAAKKLQRERLKSIEVKSGAVKDFDEYLEHFFRDSVYTEKVRSWYKAGKEDGRVVAIYPGSTLHAQRALAYPRWEDFNYELEDGVQNRMYWLGDGQTNNEKTMSGDRAWYLNDDELDIPPVPA